MIDNFFMNGYHWHVVYVHPESSLLIDRTGSFRLATTDPTTLHIYISSEVTGDLLTTVLLHELAHCVMFSYGLIDEICFMTKKRYWIEMEEEICNIIADYGKIIFTTFKDIVGDDAMMYVPREMERLIF